MAYIWFKLILGALGKKLNYESLSNLLGNAFAKDASKLVSAANPLSGGDHGKGGAGAAFAQMAGSITTVTAKTNEELFGSSDSPLGDMGWIMEAKAKESTNAE